MRRVLIASACLCLTACGEDDRGSDMFGTGASGATASGSADGGSADGGSADGGSADGDGSADGGSADDGDGSADGGDDGGDGGGVKYDVDEGADSDGGAEGGTGEHCDGVDLLFVIDDSGSMQPYQAALASTFPLFAQEIVANLPPDTDLHVGITSTSFGSPSAGGKGSSGCTNESLNAEAMADHYPPPSQDNGQNGGQGRLFEHAGKRYFEGSTADDPAALEAWFTGAAVAVGEQGSNWEMVTAGGAWIAHPDNAGFNTGFIRDKGTVLVVFVLTDEFDNSPESASVYHDMIAGAKSGCGGDDCIIAGGLIPTCVPNTANNVLNQFLNSFGEAPIIGDVGSENDTSHYPDVLGSTLAQVIAETCDEIPPEG